MTSDKSRLEDWRASAITLQLECYKDICEAVQNSVAFHIYPRSPVKATTLLKKGLESQSWSGSFWVDPVEMQCLDPTPESLCPIVGFFFGGGGGAAFSNTL